MIDFIILITESVIICWIYTIDYPNSTENLRSIVIEVTPSIYLQMGQIQPPILHEIKMHNGTYK